MSNFVTRKNTNIKERNQAESVVKRVYLSVECLCSGKGDVRSRLVGAVEILLILQEKNFPKNIRKDFSWVISQSTKFKSDIPEREGNLKATMRRIKNSTGEKIAKRIFKIYSDIQDIRGFPLLEYRNPNE